MRRLEWTGITIGVALLAGCGSGGHPPRDTAGAGALARAWLAVRAEARAVDSLAAAGDLGGARHHARILHDTAGLLPGLSGAYVSTRQGPLTMALRDMQGVIDTLATAAGRGDTLRVLQHARQLQHTVQYIGGLYPTGLLPGALQTPGGVYARPPESDQAPVARVTLDCPIHPEIRRGVPPDSVGLATCPKCGVNLVSATRTSPNTDSGASSGVSAERRGMPATQPAAGH